jgi:DNA-binding transcriptional regulator YiaG
LPREAPAPAKGHKPVVGSGDAKPASPKTPVAKQKAEARARSRPSAEAGSSAGRLASARLVSDVRSDLGVTREFFARMTGFSVRAISGWEAGRPLSEPGLRRVKEMKRLRDALAGGVQDQFIPRWLDAPCEGLGGLKPVEVLERGETDRLWRVVLLIGSGMPI